MEGGDADTNACFAGALIGALLGYKVLPPHWRDGFRYGTWLMEKTEGSQYRGGWWTRVLGGCANGEVYENAGLDGSGGIGVEEEIGG
ncbi:Thiol protease [Fusarium oxysporum f. sp. albedinis]|nr:Thiol protease [Fusarium oxysporum f. sp. albedinis]